MTLLRAYCLTLGVALSMYSLVTAAKSTVTPGWCLPLAALGAFLVAVGISA